MVTSKSATNTPDATSASGVHLPGAEHLESNWCLGPQFLDCLVGLVVKASASRAEDPGFESSLRRDFSRVESYQ